MFCAIELGSAVRIYHRCGRWKATKFHRIGGIHLRYSVAELLSVSFRRSIFQRFEVVLVDFSEWYPNA